jgi:hypothetical protein
MKLNEVQKEQVLATTQSTGWKIFEDWLVERQKELTIGTPSDLFGFFEREQTIGKIEELRTLVTTFKTHIDL